MCNDWISTQHSLPELEKDALCYRPSFRTFEVLHLCKVQGISVEYGKRTKIELIKWYPGGSGIDCISHWMPLPEAPLKNIHGL